MLGRLEGLFGVCLRWFGGWSCFRGLGLYRGKSPWRRKTSRLLCGARAGIVLLGLPWQAGFLPCSLLV